MSHGWRDGDEQRFSKFDPCSEQVPTNTTSHFNGSRHRALHGSHILQQLVFGSGEALSKE